MYKLLYKKSVEKDLRKLPNNIRKAIVAKILLLAQDPQPVGAVKLRGVTDLWRLRQGDYRVVYAITESELVILVIKIAHRREVYRSN